MPGSPPPHRPAGELLQQGEMSESNMALTLAGKRGSAHARSSSRSFHGVTRDNFPQFSKPSTTSASLRPTLPFLSISSLAYAKTGTVQRCKCSRVQACIFICLLMLGPGWWGGGVRVLTLEKCSILMLTQRYSCKRCCVERELAPACDYWPQLPIHVHPSHKVTCMFGGVAERCYAWNCVILSKTIWAN